MVATPQTSSSRCLAVAGDLGKATGLDAAVFDFSSSALRLVFEQSFCATTCPLAADGRCGPAVAHRFGCYEAERWEGQYIYYCPASLIFVATLVFEAGLPSNGLVVGPVVMGDVADLLSDLDPPLLGLIDTIPVRTAAQVGSLARVQAMVCGELSTAAPPTAGVDVPDAPVPPGPEYPFELERRLVGMVRSGDRAGAAEMINRLLAALYLASDGDFPRLRQGATDLITLFSRAAIDGGADAQSIFGEKIALDARLARFTSVDELSKFLVVVFNRFVGYVFDFSKFQHANALRQVVHYIRAHYAEHITLTDVAREVWFSPSYLSSVVSSEMGISFRAYLQAVRIEKSKERLLTTRDAMGDIAAATGFSDQSYFTKVFTKTVGMSPTQYRLQQSQGHGQG